MHMNPDAAKIKRWREERSWSQDHLAEAAGVSLRTVQRVENGDGASRETCTIKTKQKVKAEGTLSVFLSHGVKKRREIISGRRG